MVMSALEQPFRWSIASDQIVHDNGLVWAFTKEVSLDQRLSLHFSRPGPHHVFMAQVSPASSTPLVDPRPQKVEMPQKPFLTLYDLDITLSPHTLGHAFDTQVGPRSWVLIRGILWMLAQQWHMPGAIWSRNPLTQQETLDHQGQIQTVPIPLRVGRLFQHHHLQVLYQERWASPRHVQLPDIDAYSAHEKVEMIEAWSPYALKPWMKQGLGL